MSALPEALRLARALEMYWDSDSGHYRERQAAAELRRLHEENGLLRIVAEMSTLLLEALREIESATCEGGTINTLARAAIAEAEGT